jgi:hypothetical protein
MVFIVLNCRSLLVWHLVLAVKMEDIDVMVEIIDHLRSNQLGASSSTEGETARGARC